MPFTFMLETDNLLENLLMLVDLSKKDEVVNKNTSGLLKQKLFKYKKAKKTKSNFSAKTKNLANFSKAQNASTNIKAIGFLTSKARIAFI